MTIAMFGQKRLVLSLRVEPDTNAQGKIDLLRQKHGQDHQHHRQGKSRDEWKNEYLLIRGPVF